MALRRSTTGTTSRAGCVPSPVASSVSALHRPGAISPVSRAEEPSASWPPGSALTTLTPLGADPHLLFLFQSYTFFLQSYLARGFIEELPGLLS